MAIGVVIKDKDPQSDNILVYPTEMLSQEHGLIKEDTKLKIEQLVVNQNAVPIPAVFDRKSFFTAKWFNGGDDGRQTAPDVAMGETVELWQYADEVKYWWKTIFREPGLRRKEHVVHAYGNIEERGETFDLSTSYGMMFSTRDKKIRIWSASNDGEAAVLELLFDTASGSVRLRNDQGNEVGFDTQTNTTQMQTAEASVSIQGGLVKIAGAVSITGSLTVNGRSI